VWLILIIILISKTLFASTLYQSSLSNEERLNILNDYQNRITNTFKIPSSIKNQTEFWFDIYTKYSILDSVLHDRETLTIYDTVSVLDLYEKGKSPANIEITKKHREKKLLSLYKKAFLNLVKNPNKKYSHNSIENQLVKIYGKNQKKFWLARLKNLRFQTGQRDRIYHGIEKSLPFISAMESIFLQYNLPKELVVVSLLESSFNIDAKSHANAVGVWQFIESTAKEYLIIDKKNGIDERLSPIKSTHAAAKLFRRNYKIFGNYGLAIIAYNHGHSNLVKLNKKYKEKTLDKILQETNSKSLGFASRNYYLEFLALLYAYSYKDIIYNLNYNDSSFYKNTIFVRLNNKLSIFDIASKYNISLYDLKIYNPDIFKLNTKIPSGTQIVIPQNTSFKDIRSPSSLKDLEIIDYLN